MKHYPALSGAVFDTESPFRHLPRDLDSTQRRFLEGVRFAVEMTQLSNTRLRGLLTAISLQRTYTLEASPDPVASAFLDAWSMVDSIHRLRELLLATPKMKKRGPLLEVFMRATSAVEPLRNRVQHLKGDLVNPKLGHLPVWGTLGWLWIIDASLSHFLSGVLTAGSDAGALRPILTPGNRDYHDQLDHITLSVGADQVDLSEAMRLIVRLARAFEKMLRPQCEGREVLAPVDMLMLITMQHEADSALS